MFLLFSYVWQGHKIIIVVTCIKSFEKWKKYLVCRQSGVSHSQTQRAMGCISVSWQTVKRRGEGSVTSWIHKTTKKKKSILLQSIVPFFWITNSKLDEHGAEDAQPRWGSVTDVFLAHICLCSVLGSITHSAEDPLCKLKLRMGKLQQPECPAATSALQLSSQQK